jgi:hypothetical protein
MMIGLCELKLGGGYEGESNEPMPALTLGQGVEQNFQRVIGNSTNVKIGILSHEGNGHGKPTWRHERAQKMQNLPEAGTHAARNGTERSGNLRTGVHQLRRKSGEWRMANGGRMTSTGELDRVAGNSSEPMARAYPRRRSSIERSGQPPSERNIRKATKQSSARRKPP